MNLGPGIRISEIVFESTGRRLSPICVIATFLRKRFAPFGAFSRLLPHGLLLGCVLGLTTSSLSAKTSRTLIAKVDQPWKIAVLQRAGGLENRALLHLDFEKNGTTWIATSTGLVRYDGYRWQEYGQKNGLPSNFVRSVLVAKDGKIWVGTDQGAAVFDGKTFAAVGLESGLAGPSVRRIVEDSDGALWFCTDRWPQAGVTSGLSRYHRGQWSTYREKDGLPSDYVANYFRDSLGRQFVMTLNGLAFGQPRQWTYPLGRQHKMEINWTSASIVETAETGVERERRVFFEERRLA